MATWRYLTEEESKAIEELPELPAPGDEVLHIFEVIAGRVRGAGLDEAGAVVEPGWFARPVQPEDAAQALWAYEVIELRVKMNGEEVDLLAGGLVALLPPNYRELADGTA